MTEKAPERTEPDTCLRCGEDYGYCGCTQAEQLTAHVEALTSERDALAAEVERLRVIGGLSVVQSILADRSHPDFAMALNLAERVMASLEEGKDG